MLNYFFLFLGFKRMRFGGKLTEKEKGDILFDGIISPLFFGPVNGGLWGIHSVKWTLRPLPLFFFFFFCQTKGKFYYYFL